MAQFISISTLRDQGTPDRQAHFTEEYPVIEEVYNRERQLHGVE